jgi:predicted O-methyltransferase YrrM
MSMQTLGKNLSLLNWYLKRPSLYREIFRAAGRIPNRTASTRAKLRREMAEAQAWCADSSRSLADVTRAIGIPEAVPPLSEVHPQEWAAALAMQRACTVKMGGPGHVDFLYHVCSYKRPKHVVETGVAYGWSTLAILLALEHNGQGSLVSIDRPYPGIDNDMFVGCVVPASLRPRWELVRRPDRDALPQVLRGSDGIDLAHYDSDKSTEGRAFAYELLWSALRPGGVLISDDIGDNLAFRNFAEKMSRTPLVLTRANPGGEQYIGVLVK